eukprot:14214519-Heterocapsa_arctica.AAC.1
MHPNPRTRGLIDTAVATAQEDSVERDVLEYVPFDEKATRGDVRYRADLVESRACGLPVFVRVLGASAVAVLVAVAALVGLVRVGVVLVGAVLVGALRLVDRLLGGR